ncbi:MAG: hypothetical protein ACFE8E_02865 [Candidatus Hodarchaeota archaeon]
MQQNFFSEILLLIEQNCIISIHGKSGTGKTSLALHLVGWLITKHKPYQDQCLWIQASEFFPSKRLNQIFNDNDEKLQYIRNNIFIAPFKCPFPSYKEQFEFLLEFKVKILPPELRYIVIDNISHHLRYELSICSTIKEKTMLLNLFYQRQLLPLIIFCQKSGIVLILIHEVSYNPPLGKTLPFFHKLYDRIECIEIYLQNEFNQRQRSLSIKYLDLQKRIEYQIFKKGFQWIHP